MCSGSPSPLVLQTMVRAHLTTDDVGRHARVLTG